MNKLKFAILMGLFVIGLQIISLVVLAPAVHGMLSESTSYLFISSVYMLVPIFICYVKIGSFSNRFQNFKRSLLWGAVFFAILGILDLSIVVLSRYSITGKLAMPTFALSNLRIFPVIVFAIYFPVLEEILYRGYIQQLLMESMSKTGAVLITAALGTLMHFMGYPMSPKLIVIFISAIIYCLTYVKGGLTAAIIVHSMHNLLVSAQSPIVQ